MNLFREQLVAGSRQLLRTQKFSVLPNKNLETLSVRLMSLNLKESSTDTCNSTGAEVSSEEVQRFLAENKILVRGFQNERLEKPLFRFGQLELPEKVHGKIDDLKIDNPTLVQPQSIPVLSEKDLIGIAQTGSGKTLAYLLPAFKQIFSIHRQNFDRTTRHGPKVLILAPTRELAQQIYDVVYQFKNYRTICLYGGSDRNRQINLLRENDPLAVISTPGRLNDLIEAQAIRLNEIEYLVIDEADRMLDMGFESQIAKIIEKCPSTDKRQTMMFSATWPTEVQSLIGKYMKKDHAFLSIVGADLKAPKTNIKQHVHVSQSAASALEIENFASAINYDLSEDVQTYVHRIDRTERKTYPDFFLKNQNTTEFKQMCNFLKLFFTAEELFYNPSPFSLSFYELYNRVLIFKELGFRSINPSMIESHREIFYLTSGELKTNFGHILTNQECIVSLCKSLNISNQDRQSLIENINEKYGHLDNVCVSTVRCLCIAKYLSNTLKIGKMKAETWCKRYHKLLRQSSLESLNENVTLLSEKLRYPPHKVLHNALCVSLNSRNLSAILTDLKPVVGDEAFKIITNNPMFLKTDVNVLIENFKYIKGHCPGPFYIRSAELLRLPNEKLKEIFSEIENNEDVKALNLKILGIDYLAMNRQKIFERIKLLKEEDIPFQHVPLSFFVSKNSDFNKFVANACQNPESRIQFFLEEHFGLQYNSVKDTLRPLPSQVPTKYNKQNAKKIVEFFVFVNVPREKIIECVNLILFDYKLVKSAYFSACAQYQQTLHDDPNFFGHIFEYIVNNNRSKSL